MATSRKKELERALKHLGGEPANLEELATGIYNYFLRYCGKKRIDQYSFKYNFKTRLMVCEFSKTVKRRTPMTSHSDSEFVDRIRKSLEPVLFASNTSTGITRYSDGDSIRFGNTFTFSKDIEKIWPNFTKHLEEQSIWNVLTNDGKSFEIHFYGYDE